MELITEPVPILLPESVVDSQDGIQSTANVDDKNAPFWKSVVSLGAGRSHTIIVTSDAVYSLG